MIIRANYRIPEINKSGTFHDHRFEFRMDLWSVEIEVLAVILSDPDIDISDRQIYYLNIRATIKFQSIGYSVNRDVRDLASLSNARVNTGSAFGYIDLVNVDVCCWNIYLIMMSKIITVSAEGIFFTNCLFF